MRALVGAYVGRRQVIIVDSKHDPAYNGIDARYATTLQGVTRAKYPKVPVVVWRPSGESARDYQAYDTLFDWVYSRGNTCLVIDEVSQVVQGAQTFGPGFNDVVTRGRVRGLTVFYGTQRPAYVPRIIYSESQRFFVCYVSDKSDRERIAAFTRPELAQEVPDQHGFWYYNSKSRSVQYFAGLDL
jgi:hypothetical protein